MPHVSRFKLDGLHCPSVSTITGALAKEGLTRWYRRLGFKACDKISDKAKAKGTEVATMFESYRKTRALPRKKFLKTVLKEWQTTEASKPGVMLVAEPHLVNTVANYHGSPDLVYNNGINWTLADDKCKNRFADYGLLMNEHGYAMCDTMHDTLSGEFKPVPWEIPIQDIVFWTYHPDTGKLYPIWYKFDEAVYQDFLLCRRMYELNRKAEKYFTEHATSLPEEVVA